MDADAILSQLSIPHPCPVDWDRMSGDDRVRYCAGCGKRVYNLTVMTSVETDLLISTVPQHGERRCVRLYQRHDGTLSPSGCQPSAQGAAKPWQFTIRSLMVIIAGGAAVLGLTKWLSHDQTQSMPPPAVNSQIIMGDIY
jgi:hypothetical protein